MPDLSDLVPFYSGQVRNNYLLVLGQVQKSYCNSMFYYPHAFLKKRQGYCNRLRPSVRPSIQIWL